MYLQLLHYGATFLLSVALALYLTPIIRRGALKYSVLDYPDGALKVHAEPVPYLGGIAVYLAFLVTLAVVFDFRAQVLGLLLGGTMVAMLGLFDDMRVLPPRLKIAGQLIAIVVVIKSDIRIELAFLPEFMSIPLTAVWVLGVTNAINIIDVSDGLSSGTAAIAALGLFILAAVSGDVLIATTTLALVGALIGFLRYNQPPAKIYLGDTGSMFVGFMLACLSMIGTYRSDSPVAAVVPLCILIVPILEVTLVSIARLSRGASPFVGSRDHFILRLRDNGWTIRRATAYGYAVGLGGVILAVAITLVGLQLALVFAGTAAVFFLSNLVALLRLRCGDRGSAGEPAQVPRRADSSS